jgi:hypothetical protein
LGPGDAHAKFGIAEFGIAALEFGRNYKKKEMFCFIMGRIRRISKKIRAPVIYRSNETREILKTPFFLKKREGLRL